MTALDRLRDLFRRDKASVAGLLSEWFYGYHSDLYVHGVPFDVYVEKARGILRAIGPARRVLDVGAGFGVYAALLRILGVPEVVALDYHLPKARDARRLMDHLGLDGVRVLQGDATALSFRPGSFDAAVALASLSHIRDARRALREVASAMSPGARLYVFEDNNSSHFGYRERMSRIWEGAETGTYAPDVPAEKRIAEPYVEIRRRMIAEKFPRMSPEAVDRCARGTRGLYGRQIFRTVEEFLAAGRLDAAAGPGVCHPVSGEYEEFPLNPSLVRGMLREAGFDSRLRSPLTGPFRGRRKVLAWTASRVYALCPALASWTSGIFAVRGTLRQARG